MKVQSKDRSEAGRKMEAADITQALKKICPERFPESKTNPSLGYRCDCSHQACHKVMRRATVQKKSKRSRFQCPAHAPGHPNYSKYVRLFAAKIKKIDHHAKIIYDWRCIPRRKNMSIDATVLRGDKCTNFEIDGEHHFNEKECTRDELDEVKDREISELGCGLMRLHYKDRDQWEQYIRHHLASPQHSMQCTPSYAQYMVGNPYDPVVLNAADVCKNAL